jgi:hypothetical protein
MAACCKDLVLISLINFTNLSHLFNPLNAELNPICHLLTLLGSHHILHISTIRIAFGFFKFVCILFDYKLVSRHAVVYSSISTSGQNVLSNFLCIAREMQFCMSWSGGRRFNNLLSTFSELQASRSEI